AKFDRGKLARKLVHDSSLGGPSEVHGRCASQETQRDACSSSSRPDVFEGPERASGEPRSRFSLEIGRGLPRKRDPVLTALRPWPCEWRQSSPARRGSSKDRERQVCLASLVGPIHRRRRGVSRQCL